ncbi:MAG: class II aldolase/adducin family protein [Deltaproteobacteria bacterium]|nr:class II aldolase/adducin family protein [Deltaproteobacteria bacterium]
MQLWQAKDAIVEIGRRLWQRGYVAANDGNISVRLEDQRLLTTPTGVSKGFMSADMLVVTDLQGNPVEAECRPSSELKMHLEVYRLRPEVNAVVHAHPPVATAFSVAGVALDKCILPESVLTMGAIPTVPYATPSTEEVPEGLRPFIPNCDAVLLSNHGAMTWAAALETAYFRMETLEHTAKITQAAMMLGDLNLLNLADIEKLDTVRQKLGISGRVMPCESAGTCSKAPDLTSQDPLHKKLVEAVTLAVLKALGRV